MRQRARERSTVLIDVQPQVGEVSRLEKLAQEAAERGQIEDAMSLANTIINIQPEHAEAHNFLGTMFSRAKRPLDAFRSYSRAIALDKRHFRAFSNISITLNDLDKFDAAVLSATAAIEIAPDFEGSYMNLATIYASRGQTEKAVDAYLRLLAVKPKATGALIEVHFLLLMLCDWDRIAPVRAAIMKGTTFLKDPRQVWGFSTSPLVHQISARMWTEGLAGDAAPLAAYEPRPADLRTRPLRIGYLSADFKYHATAMLIVEMLELHDRQRFETFGYCIGTDDGSAMRERITGAFSRFVDLTALSDVQAAERIHADGIDILVDLMGYTKTARTGIVARRPAPIQINYLGYPGTMGADFIDYIVADEVVIPPGAEVLYDERVVRLPFCYQPNDRKRQIAGRQPTRTDCGLPVDAFVFCSFNSTYKITEEVFAVWMRLLAAVPHAVLWVLEDSESAAGNLREQAARRGVDPARLIFGPRLLNAAHLARLRLADLFLDTLPVTAHTTASDAMWAGLPLLTCVEEAFVSRVAASVLLVMGLGELVAADLADYEAKALHYARHPEDLSRIRDHLQESRSTTPLFDTPRYTRHFEQALSRMAALRDAGRPTESFDVPADDEPGA